MWWVIIGKWKNDINSEPRWKPIRMSNARDINYFTKKNLQTANVMSDYW